MKTKAKILSCLLLKIAFLFSSGGQIFGQEKVNISAGIGFQDLLNLGCQYRLDQMQLGISLGSWPEKDYSQISVSGDIYYHFGRLPELSDLRPWYGRIGYNYNRSESQSNIHKYQYLNLRIGRDFNFSHKIGIALDAGFMVQLDHEVTEKVHSSGLFSGMHLEFPVLPGFGIRVFYKIYKVKI